MFKIIVVIYLIAAAGLTVHFIMRPEFYGKLYGRFINAMFKDKDND